MAKRRSVAQWNSLSAAYRARLERSGVSRAQYLRGNRLSSARGHAATPERPERATRNPKRYSAYLDKTFQRFKAELKQANPLANPEMRFNQLGPRQANQWTLWHQQVRAEKVSTGAVSDATYNRGHTLYDEDLDYDYEDVDDFDDMYWY